MCIRVSVFMLIVNVNEQQNVSSLVTSNKIVVTGRNKIRAYDECINNLYCIWYYRFSVYKI